MTRRYGLIVAAVLTGVLASRARAQAGLIVTVLDSVSGGPVSAAVVTALPLGRAERTDRLGRARFPNLTRPAAVSVAAVGFVPQTVIVADSTTELFVSLAPGPVTLPGLTVAAAPQTALSPAAAGVWIIPHAALEQVPTAVEPDPLRALALVPGVTFTTPLSARPIIRGYDAVESVTRIDGFEVLNPYHVGRILSAFPLDATEAVSVATLPAHGGDGVALAGVIDIRGRASDPTRDHGGIDVSPVSASGWWSGASGFPVFVSGRAAWLGIASRLAGPGLPYDFQDFYAHSRGQITARHPTEATLYATHDDIGTRGNGTGAEWSNVLGGVRWRLMDRPTAYVDVTGSVNHFQIDGTEISARDAEVDLLNRFTRASGGFEGAVRAGALVLSGGASVGERRVQNTLTVRSGEAFAPERRDTRLVELQGYAEAAWTSAATTLSAGARWDASGSAQAWQPRLRAALSLGQHATLALAAARASRLLQVVTDPEPEPTIAVFDYWRAAGQDGIPVPRVDHAAIEVDAVSGAWAGRAAGFVSRGRGLGELRPVTDQVEGLPAFRFGDSRTRGLELRVARQPRTGAFAAALTYVLSWSDRRWEDGVWRPWRLDRRHLLRLQLEAAPGRWHVVAVGEMQSGQPLTSVAEIVWRTYPPLPEQSGGSTDLLPRYRYGAEGGGRGAATFHCDLGAQVRMTGPWHSRMALGFGLTNATFGPVAPDEPASPAEVLSQPERGVFYERRFDLPAIPTVTVRIEF